MHFQLFIFKHTVNLFLKVLDGILHHTTAQKRIKQDNNSSSIDKQKALRRYSIYNYNDNTGILGQVWYFMVSIPDLCTLTYFQAFAYIYHNFLTPTGSFYALHFNLMK